MKKHAWMGDSYPDKLVASMPEDEQEKIAISEFQRFAGLQMTGN